METPGSQRGDGRPDRPHHGLVVLVPAACSITGMRATLEQRERGGGASGHQNPQLAVPWVGRSIGLLRRASSRLLDDASQGREAEGGGACGAPQSVDSPRRMGRGEAGRLAQQRLRATRGAGSGHAHTHTHTIYNVAGRDPGRRVRRYGAQTRPPLPRQRARLDPLRTLTAPTYVET
jgi:hypothetical protein